MKRFIAVLVVLFATLQVASAQSLNDTFKKGDRYLNVGLSLPVNNIQFNSLPPVIVSYDQCIKDNLFDANSSLGVGAIGSVGYYGNSTMSLTAGGRGTVHYAFMSKLDTYLGLELGYSFVKAGDLTGGAVHRDFLLGARYLFSPKFAGILELGTYNLTAGISIRL